MRGSYTGAGILIGDADTRPLASAENVQETNTRLHVQARQIGAGAVAVRAHRGGVGVHTGDRVMWVRRGAVRVC